MRYYSIVCVIFGMLLNAPQSADAYSFEGGDWFINMTGVMHVNVAELIETDEPVNQSNEPVTITQSSMSNIVVPVPLPDPVNDTFFLPATISGEYVHSFLEIGEYGPITFDYEGDEYTIKLANIVAQLDGYATGINLQDTTGNYGARAFYITGRQSPDSYLEADIQMELFGEWGKVGEADLEISSWSAERGEGVPEPGTIAMLVSMVASFIGYSLVRRRC